jgi:hypothetical protein
LVYDASYKQDPTVVSLLKYINDMFTLKHDITEPGKNYGWLKRSLGIKMIEKYKVTGYRGDKLLHAQQNKLPLKDIALDFGTLSSHLTKDVIRISSVKSMIRTFVSHQEVKFSLILETAKRKWHCFFLSYKTLKLH